MTLGRALIRCAFAACASALFASCASAPVLDLVRRSGYERASLPAGLEPARFDAMRIEPRSPRAFAAWYRAVFHGGASAESSLSLLEAAFFGKFREESARLNKEFGPEAVHPWYFEEREFIAYADARLLVRGCSRAEYRGGAHGLYGTEYAIIDLSGRRVLGLAELFIPGSDARLSALLTRKAREVLGLAEGTPLQEAGFFVDAVPPSPNLFVHAEGLGFHYNVYDIAPYAMGEIVLLLSFEELDALLRSDMRTLFGLSRVRPEEEL